jgi:hypothetical protein
VLVKHPAGEIVPSVNGGVRSGSDQQATGRRARAALDWNPTRPDVLTELAGR